MLTQRSNNTDLECPLFISLLTVPLSLSPPTWILQWSPDSLLPSCLLLCYSQEHSQSAPCKTSISSVLAWSFLPF